jgi:hypothetical protein
VDEDDRRFVRIEGLKENQVRWVLKPVRAQHVTKASPESRAGGLRRIKPGLQIHRDGDVLSKGFDGLDPRGIGKEEGHVPVRTGQHECSRSHNKAETRHVRIQLFALGNSSDHRQTEPIPMKAAHTHAGFLDGRNLREIARIEKVSPTLFPNSIAFEDGQQSHHRLPIVCESERALMEIDSLCAKDRTGLADGFFGPSPVPRPTGLHKAGLMSSSRSARERLREAPTHLFFAQRKPRQVLLRDKRIMDAANSLINIKLSLGWEGGPGVSARRLDHDFSSLETLDMTKGSRGDLRTSALNA